MLLLVGSNSIINISIAMLTTNGLDCVANMNVFTATSLKKPARASSHAAVRSGTFGTINGSN